MTRDYEPKLDCGPYSKGFVENLQAENEKLRAEVAAVREAVRLEQQQSGRVGRALEEARAQIAALRKQAEAAISLDDYECDNLRWLLDLVCNDKPFTHANTGDWVGQILHKLPPTKNRPNVTREELLDCMQRAEAAALSDAEIEAACMELQVAQSGFVSMAIDRIREQVGAVSDDKWVHVITRMQKARDDITALLRRTQRAAPAPSALVEAARRVVLAHEPIDDETAFIFHDLKAALAASPSPPAPSGIIGGMSHLTVEDADEIARLRRENAALKAASIIGVAVPEDVRAAATEVVGCEHSFQPSRKVARFVLSLPAAATAAPQPDAELQRLLDEYRKAHDGFASPQTRLCEALAQKLGCS